MGQPLQLKIDLHVMGNRGRRGECVDIFRVRVDNFLVFLDIGKIAQRLNAPAVAQAPIVMRSFWIVCAPLESSRGRVRS